MSEDVKKEFYEYGKKMKLVAIFTIIPFLNIIAYIILWTSLSDLLNANMKLNNTHLENYRSKFTTVLILRFVGFGLSVGNWIFPAWNPFMVQAFSPIGMSIQGIGWVIALIAGIIEMGAWQSYIEFFEQTSIFPSHIHSEVVEGGKNLKTAALMYILSFLIITAFIGWILSIIGYFKLATLETVPHAKEVTSPSETSTPAPTPPPVVSSVKFCPSCGEKVEDAGKFCGVCGAKL